MLADVKSKRHTWSFVNSFRAPYRKVNVFECKRCKCSKSVYYDSLTHSHIKTEFVIGIETTTKTPDCMTKENVLF